MNVYGTQQTASTISQNVSDWAAMHIISDEQAAKQDAEYRAEKRLRYIRSYLRQRASRKAK